MKNFWLNLPVKDITRSRRFFNDLGFEENPMHKDNPEFASFYLDENKTVLMLFEEERFAHFSGNPVADTSKGTEAFLNIDAPNREFVDEFSKTVKKAGGEVYAEPAELDGWMYLMGFIDPDGHRWGMLYMDMDKMPKEK